MARLGLARDKSGSVDDRPVGYYQMHSDYPGGVRQADPTVEQTYEVLAKFSDVHEVAIDGLRSAQDEASNWLPTGNESLEDVLERIEAEQASTEGK